MSDPEPGPDGEFPYLYARGKLWVPLDEVRAFWQQWKKAWGTGDSEEALALMEMDMLLGVGENGEILRGGT